MAGPYRAGWSSHRGRNSESVFDAGAFDETLETNLAAGRPVYAACGSVVEEQP